MNTWSIQMVWNMITSEAFFQKYLSSQVLSSLNTDKSGVPWTLKSAGFSLPIFVMFYLLYYHCRLCFNDSVSCICLSICNTNHQNWNLRELTVQHSVNSRLHNYVASRPFAPNRMYNEGFFQVITAHRSAILL